MTDHTPEPCGCRTEGEYFRSIVYCSTHAAAPALLVTLKEIAEERIPPSIEGDSEAIRYWQQDRALAALAQAKGEE